MESGARDVHSVYALVDPRSGAIRYVGMAADAAIRLRRHLRNAGRSRAACSRWISEIRGSGETPEMVVLQEYRDRRSCDIGERYWIARARDRGCDLLNQTSGGQCGILSAEARAKSGAKNRGRIPSAETRAKMSAAAKSRVGRIVSAETRAKISASNKGKGHGAAWRAAQAEAIRGRKASPETRAKMSISRRGNQNARRRISERKSAPNATSGD